MAQWNPCGPHGIQGDHLAQHHQHDQPVTASDTHNGLDLWEIFRPLKRGIKELLPLSRPGSSWGSPSQQLDRDMKQVDFDSSKLHISWPRRLPMRSRKDSAPSPKGEDRDKAAAYSESSDTNDLVGVGSHLGAFANPDTDWAQISDLAERRRIQNRIAQRNYRRKLRRRLEDLERRAGASDSMELQKSKMSEELQVQHKEDGVSPQKGDGYDVAHAETSSADFIDLVNASNQPHLATIDEQDHEYAWSFSPPPPYGQLGSDYYSNNSSPRSAVSWPNRPSKRPSNSSTVGSATSTVGSIFDAASLSRASTSFGTDSGSFSFNEMSSSLPRRSKRSSPSPSPSFSDSPFTPLSCDAEGLDIPRRASPDVGTYDWLQTILDRGNYDGYATRSTISQIEATISNGGRPERSSTPTREMARLSIGNLAANGTRGPPTKPLVVPEVKCPENEHVATPTRDGQGAGNAKGRLAPPVLDVALTSVLGSSPDSASEQDRSFQTPGTQDPLTPATSLADDSTEQDDDLVSDEFSDVQDDDSFLEALSASSLDPSLLPLVLTLREYVMTLAEQSAEAWRSRGGGDRPHGSRSSSAVRPATSLASPGNASGRKRALSNGGSNSPDEDDEEDAKRQRTDLDQEDEADTDQIFFACPFAKRNPEKNWPKSCWAGYTQVHRIKEHITRRHLLPPHCDRCFEEFASEEEKLAHTRAVVPCSVAPPPDASRGIDGDRLTRIKSRKGIQKKPELVKWRLVYEIIFPNETIPDAYADIARIRKPEKAGELHKMTPLYMQAIEGRFQNAPEHLRHYILDEVRKGLDSLPEILASNLPPKSVSPQASPQEEVPEESGPSGSAAQQGKPEGPKPPSEAPTATNDEDSNSNSGSDVEYCPHTEGRIRYPNLACKECQRNFDFQQTFYMGLAM